MRSLRLVLIVCGLLVFTVFTSWQFGLPIHAANSANGVVTSVTGSTHMTVPLSVFGFDLDGDVEMRTLSYNARQHADGSVSGHYEYHYLLLGDSFKVRGRVICLKVEDNAAWIGATVDDTNDPTVEGLYSWWQVRDNGEGANSSADRTTFLGFGTLAETIEYCEGPAPNFIFDIDHGNVQIH